VATIKKGRRGLAVEFKRGERIGRLTIRRKYGKNKGNQLYVVDCDCGKRKRIRACHLNGGKVLSCGCLHREKVTKHGGTAGRTKTGKTTLTYASWSCMRQRCNPKYRRFFPAYSDVTVDGRWNKDYTEFKKDMGERPGPDYEIDRIDPFGNYEPSNCRWLKVGDPRHRNRAQILRERQQKEERK
jgi:hypothetical protein